MISSEKLNEILKIDDSNLIYDIKRQAELLFWVGTELSELESIVEHESIKLDAVEANLAVKIRKEHKENNEKITEKALSELIASDTKLRKRKYKLIDLKKSLKILQFAHKSLVAKGSMLEQISFNKRKEIDFNIRKQAIKKRNKGVKNG